MLIYLIEGILEIKQRIQHSGRLQFIHLNSLGCSGAVNGAMVLAKIFSEFLVRSFLQRNILPEIWGQVRVCLCDGSVGSLGEITKSTSGSPCGCVAILDTRHLQKLLRYWSRHNSRSSGCGNQAHLDGSTLASHLARYRMGLTDFVTPVTKTHGNDRQFCEDDGTSNCSRYFLGALHTQTNVTGAVSNGDESLQNKEKDLIRNWGKLGKKLSRL